jgi:hypothetical protein
MLVRLGFTESASRYMVRRAGLDSLKEVAYLDDDDAESLIKHGDRPDGSTTVGNGAEAVTTSNMGCTVSIRAEENLKRCVFYLKHCIRVTRTPKVALIDMDLVCGFHDQMKWEESFKKTEVEPVSNDKDWPRTLDNMREFRASIIGDT